MRNQGSSYSHVLHKAVVSGPSGLMVYIYVHAVHSCGVTLLFEGEAVKLHLICIDLRSRLLYGNQAAKTLKLAVFNFKKDGLSLCKMYYLR